MALIFTLLYIKLANLLRPCNPVYLSDLLVTSLHPPESVGVLTLCTNAFEQVCPATTSTTMVKSLRWEWS